MEPLLQTKLFVPGLRRGVVIRPRLQARLAAAEQVRLVLVVAPAGFGKTTLVTQWLAEQSGAVAWLSLDPFDNEPNRFCTYLLAAIQTVLPEVGRSLRATLATGQTVDSRGLVPALLNELNGVDQPLTLILDDYQFIDNELIHSLMADLIDYLPAGVRLVMTSREEPPLPLPRWRVRGQLVEIRQDDLRFDLGESGRFMSETMALSLADSDIASLNSQTEGWVAGLQLAALSMLGGRDSEQILASIHGADRHVADYLVQEVIAHQSADIQAFLLNSSVLDRFNGALCDEILGREDSRQVLRDLEQANLFLVPLDRQRNWYRFHHLFGQLLQQKLTDTESEVTIQALHRRASGWFEANGFADEAISHALLAEDFDKAAEMVANYSLEDVYNQGGTNLVKTWYEALPEASVKRFPRAAIMAAGAYLVVGQLADTQRSLDLVADEPSVAAEFLLFRSIIIRNDAADFAESLRLAEAAYEGLRGRGLADESMALLQVAINHLEFGNLTASGAAIEQILELIEVKGGSHMNLMLQASHMGAVVAMAVLDFARAERQCRATLAKGSVADEPVSPMIGWVHALIAQIYYEWDEVAQAEEHITIARRWADRSGMTDIIFQTIRVEARLAGYRKDTSAIQEIAENLEEMAMLSRIANIAELIKALVATLYLQIGQLDKAVRWANGARWGLDDMPTFGSLGPHMTLARVRLAESRALGEPSLTEPILPLLERLVKVTKETEHRYGLLELLVVQALVLDWGDRPVAATQSFNEALDLAAPASIRRLILDFGPPLRPLLQRSLSHNPAFVTDLLNRFDMGDRPSESQKAAVAINLTEREREVLQAIVAGLSNKEIETSLFISKNTVRTHIKNLYSKLAVTSRTQAVRVAREKGLL